MERKMRVLLGYDGSNESENAIRNLRWAGLPDRTLAAVLSAADVFLPGPPDKSTTPAAAPAIHRAREHAQGALRLAESLSEHGAQRIKKEFPTWKVFPEACADSPAWALIKKADEWKADLIAVGAHGHSKLGRFLGSVSQMVLVHAKQSVRISRSRPDGAEEWRVLLGLDGSVSSKKVVETVLARSWPLKTKFLLLSILEPTMSAVRNHLMPTEIQWMFKEADDEQSAVGQMLEADAKRFRAAKLNVTTQVGLGDPKQVIVNEAESWMADSIFIGARGLSGVKRMLLGGVSAAVAARAHCSVEVVR